MGDPDLSLEPPGPPAISLAELIRAGDPDALAGFRHAHMAMVRNYCAAVCDPARVGEACHAAFLDFLGRVQRFGAEAPLDEVLLAATRSAAASRVPATTENRVCAAVPELLAASANGEQRGSPDAVERHVGTCLRCREVAGRMSLAEDAFAAGPG